MQLNDHPRLGRGGSFLPAIAPLTLLHYVEGAVATCIRTN